MSLTDITMLEECPARWRSERLRERGPSTMWSRIGRACHDACAAVAQWTPEAGSDPATVGIRAIDLNGELSLLERHMAEEIMSGALYGPEPLIAAGAPRGARMSAAAVIGLREDWSACALDDPLAVYVVRFDRLVWYTASGTVRVEDISMGQDWIAAGDLHSDARAQWASNAALSLFPDATQVTYKRTMLRLGYSVEGVFVGTDAWRVSIRKRAALACAMRARAEVDAAIEPVVGGWCQHCSVRGNCRKFVDLLDRGSWLPADEPAPVAARHLGALKGAVKEYEAVLREEVRQHGPIKLPNHTELGMHPKSVRTLRLPLEQVKDRLRDLGMDARMESEMFAPSERSTPGIVRKVLERLVNRGALDAYMDELTSSAVSLEFSTKEVKP